MRTPSVVARHPASVSNVGAPHPVARGATKSAHAHLDKFGQLFGSGLAGCASRRAGGTLERPAISSHAIEEIEHAAENREALRAKRGLGEMPVAGRWRSRGGPGGRVVLGGGCPGRQGADAGEARGRGRERGVTVTFVFHEADW